jgi:hypothetical protein
MSQLSMAFLWHVPSFNRREMSKGVCAEMLLCANSASHFLCGEKDNQQRHTRRFFERNINEEKNKNPLTSKGFYC